MTNKGQEQKTAVRTSDEAVFSFDNNADYRA